MTKYSKRRALRAVDFFCGAGGMSQGLEDAGISVIAALDNDPICEDTYMANHPDSKFLRKDIKDYDKEKLGEDVPKLEIEDDNMVFIGCSPCQHWSGIRHKKASSMKTRNLLKYFLKFVEHYKPGFVVIENVVGIKKNEEESGLSDIYNFFDKNNYRYKNGRKTLPCKFYGVPQTRQRFIVIASRVKDINISSIKKDDKYITVQEALKDIKGKNLPTLSPGEICSKDHLHKVSNLSEKNIQRLKLTDEGGGNHKWRDDDVLGINAYRNKSGFYLNYGRMAWDKPAPTITTKFFSLGSGQFGHPTENRTISLREGALLQTFPHDYKFSTTSFGKTARLIGNAVPPAFAKRIGDAIMSSFD